MLITDQVVTASDFLCKAPLTATQASTWAGRGSSASAQCVSKLRALFNYRGALALFRAEGRIDFRRFRSSLRENLGG